MKITMKTLLLIGIVFLSFSLACFAQSTPATSKSPVQPAWENATPASLAPSVRIGNGSVVREKFGFYWETRIVPPTPGLAGGFTTMALTDATPFIHRVMLDRSGRTYFGYDAIVDILPEANTYQVTFRPLVMTDKLALGFNMDALSAWVPLAAPRFPAPQTVHGGEVLEFTLLTNAATKQSIVDYVSIQDSIKSVPSFQFFFDVILNGNVVHDQPDRAPRDFSFATGTPRDINSNDVGMVIKSPRISINGKLDELTQSRRTDTAIGTFIWFYLPNRGRFILSLGPHADLGFRKAGEVRGSSLAFTIGSDRFTLSAGDRIPPGLAAFNLYVLNQPNWKPTYLFADLNAFNIGAADRFEELDGK